MPEIIKPNLAPLTERTKQRLITIADSYVRSHYDNVLHYLQTGEITIEEMPLLDNVPEIREKLRNDYHEWLHQPDPQEKADWKVIQSQIPDDLKILSLDEVRRIQELLKKYIDKYSATLPGGNSVGKAQELSRELASAEVDHDWANVDLLDYDSLIAFYNKHKASLPETILNQLDDYLWEIVYYEPVNVSKVAQFASDFPASPKHFQEAKKIASAFSDWEKVKASDDVYAVFEYIKSHESSPFLAEAKALLSDLGKKYLENLKMDMGNKTWRELEDEIIKGLFNYQNFIDAGIITERGINVLKRVDEQLINPNVDYVQYDVESLDLPNGKTDVYFFGVPGSGKTCVIMGLLNSELLNWDAVRFGGRTGLQLQQLCYEGYPANRTMGELANVITGEISEDSGNIKHPVNLIDMSGEDFVVKIADNPDAKVSFADMGKGIPELLNNQNEKIFFFVFDPVNEYVLRSEEEDGKILRREVSQRKIFQQFCSMLADPENAHVMKKVK
ncbi:MAG: hypothetical protein ACI395_09455, partial [Candidatus Cryptobacteroides sp.]